MYIPGRCELYAGESVQNYPFLPCCSQADYVACIPPFCISLGCSILGMGVSRCLSTGAWRKPFVVQTIIGGGLLLLGMLAIIDTPGWNVSNAQTLDHHRFTIIDHAY